ncbi:tetratricopeptide repeat protein [Nocardia alni]|uniref:tetratricopeptide repeat protein n=1 Tax=Nocardia alni TaxID=2815723 RepID=UPI001C24A6DF|nr:tetratricopeptide repeat protein [Nocardia alni]
MEAGGDIIVTATTIVNEAVPSGSRGRVVVGGIPQRPANFVPRTELQALREVLGRSQGAAVVTGMRGVGKTQLAAAVAREANDAGADLVGWIPAENNGVAHEALAEIAERFGVADPGRNPAVSAVRLRDFLSSRAESGLLVFDNATDPDSIRTLLPTGGATQVVITSTDRSFAALGESIDIRPYTREESLAHLQAATGLTDTSGAYRIADTLGDLPLALSAAAATITGRHLDYDRYHQLLRAQPLPRVLARRKGHDYPLSVTQAILLSVDTTEAATGDPELDEIVRWLLGAVAMLSPSGVLRRLLPDRGGRVDEALDRCVTSTLLSSSTTGDIVIMHRLIGRVLRERATSTKAIDHLTISSIDILTPQLFDPQEAWTQRAWGSHLIDQIDSLWDTGLPVTTPDQLLLLRVLEARNWAVHQLHEAGDLARSFAHACTTLTDCERILRADHPTTLTARGNLGQVYASTGQPDKAIPLHEAVLADGQRRLGINHPETLVFRNNLAYACRLEGRLDKAISLFEAIVVDSERLLGADHPRTLAYRNNLANTYACAGRLDKAVPLYKALVEDRTRRLGADHPDTLAARINVAYACRLEGRLDEAISLYEAIGIDSERWLGADHPNTLTCRDNLALAYGFAGQPDKAIPLLKTTLIVRTRVLGADHPHTRTCRNNLADAYILAGKLDKAIPLYKALLADSEQRRGADHEDTAVFRNTLAYLVASTYSRGRP